MDSLMSLIYSTTHKISQQRESELFCFTGNDHVHLEKKESMLMIDDPT